MTAIVALIENGVVYMAGDRACGTGDTMRTHMATPKIGRRGAYLFGGSGDARPAEILRHAPGIPKPPARMIDRFMALRFTAWARDAHAANGLALAKDGRREMDGMLLVGVAGRLYLMDGQYSVVRVEDFEAIGSGCELAIGALYATRGRPPRERLQIAMETAARYMPTVFGPFDVLTLGEAESPSKADKLLRRAWAKTYENNRKRRAS